MTRVLLVAALLTAGVGVAGAAAADPYQEILSANAECRDFYWQAVDAVGAEKLRDAEKYLKKAVDKDANCFLAYIMLSQISYVYKDDKKATSYLEKIPPEPPELAAAYEDLCRAMRDDDYNATAAKADRILEAYPQTITAVATLHLLARAQYFLGEKDKALFTLRAAFLYSDLAPGTVPAYGSNAEMMELETFAGRR